MKNELLGFVLGAVVCAWLPRTASADSTKNPTGPTGEFSGSITTGGSIDPYTGNAKRFITDLSVTGAVGAYPLKWTRVLNTRGGRMGPLGGGGQWAHSYQWGLFLDREPPADWDDPEGGEYTGPGGKITYPDGRTVDLQTGDFVNYAPIQPFDGVDRVVPAGGDDYTLLLRDGGKVKFTSYAGAPSRGSLRPTEIVDPHGQVTGLFYDNWNRLIQVKEPAGRYLWINWVDKSYWRSLGGQMVHVPIYLIDNVQVFAAPGNLVETVRYGYEEETISDPWGWLRTYNLTHAYYDDATQGIYGYFPSTLASGGHAVSSRIKSCDDVRFDGPMKQIEYEYLEGTGAPEGVVKKEKNLRTGQTVAEVIYPANCFNPPNGDPSYQRRTERRPDGAMRTFQYADIANNGTYELQSYSDFQNHWSSIAYGGAPNGNWTKILTDARLKTTTIEKEPVTDQPIRIYNPDTPQSSKGFFYYQDPDGGSYHVAIQGDELNRNTYYTRAAPDWRVTKIWYGFDSSNHNAYPTEEFTYNNFGQVLSHKLTTGGTESFGYDNEALPATRGLKTRWTDAMGHTTRYEYYPNGPHTDRLWKITDPRENTTTFEYNLRGQVTKVTHQDGYYTQSKYNDDGTLEWTADENHPGAVNDPNGRTRYVYDDYKRVISVTNPENETSTNSYAPWNGAGALSHTTSSVYRSTSPMGKKTDFDYDDNFRLKMVRKGVESVDDDGGTWFEYDEAGNQRQVTDPRGKITTFEYDGRNRKIWMKNPIATDRNSNGHTMEWKYDGVGNKIKEIRADDAFRTWEYEDTNPMNRLTKTIDWRMSAAEPAMATVYGRNVPSTQETITDAKGAVYTFRFDYLHRKTSATYPMDATSSIRTETWDYDPAGNLKLHKNPAGQYKHLDFADSYDSRNRLRHSAWNLYAAENSPPNHAVGPETRMVYDAAGRMTSITTNGGATTVSFGYDEANRQIWEDQTLAGYPTRRVDTPRDADGARTLLHVPGSYAIRYDYTQRGQLRTIYDAGWTPWFNYAYDANGNMTKRQDVMYGVNDSTNIPSEHYDALNRPTVWQQTWTGDNPFACSWMQYDSVNRMTAIWRNEQGNKGEAYGYNTRGQLTRARSNANNVWSNPSGGALTTYNLDALNRTGSNGVNANGTQIAYSPNPLNQYTSVGGQSHEYDGNFNLTSSPGFIGSYNAANQLTSAYGQNALFTYDGLGRCVKRTINGVTSVLIYDGWKPILEWNGNGHFVAWNIYGAGPDEILWRYQVGVGHLRYKLNEQGSVAFLLDVHGNILERYKYDAFGDPTVTDWTDWNEVNPRTWSAYGNRFMFTGREFIWELRIYDYRNRFYHPKLGRFLQPDPTGFDGGDMNLFRYCNDDPVDLSDPMGLAAQENGAGRDFGTILRDWTWDRASWFDGANNRQGTYAEHTRIMDTLSMGWQPRNEPAKSNSQAMRFVPTKLANDGITVIPRLLTHAYNEYEYQFADFSGKRVAGAGYTVLEKLKTISGEDVADKQTRPRPLQSNGIFPDRVGLSFRPSRAGKSESIAHQTFEVKYNGQPISVSTVLGHHVREINGQVDVRVWVVTP